MGPFRLYGFFPVQWKDAQGCKGGVRSVGLGKGVSKVCEGKRLCNGGVVRGV